MKSQNLVYECWNMYVQLNIKATTFLNAVRCLYTLLNFRTLVIVGDYGDDYNNKIVAIRKNSKSISNSRKQ